MRFEHRRKPRLITIEELINLVQARYDAGKYPHDETWQDPFTLAIVYLFREEEQIVAISPHEFGDVSKGLKLINLYYEAAKKYIDRGKTE